MSDPTAQADLPDEVRDALERLGPCREEFPGSAANAIAGIILGALGVIVGVAGTIFIVVALINMGFDSRILRAAILPVLGVGGWVTLRWGIRHRFVRMYVCEKGFVHRVGNSVGLYPWTALVEIVQDKVKEGLEENGYPFMNRGTTFLIKRKDGAQLGIDANLLKQHLKFMRLVYSLTRPYEVPWVLLKS
jgi:hypothetical protein